MSRKCQVCVTLVLGIVFSGSAMVANATLITAALGDFAAETKCGAEVGSDLACGRVCLRLDRLAEPLHQPLCDERHGS